MKSKMILVLTAIFISSCNKKTEVSPKLSIRDTLHQDISEETETESEVVFTVPEFPKTGKNADDFVVSPYIIKMKAEGFLNDDGLKDIVIVLQNENDNADSRAVLVLLKQKTGEYKLQDISWEALDPEYTDTGYHIYMSEEIYIENKILHIMLQSGGGPSGTRETLYRYVNDNLILIKMHTFNSGAGSDLSSDYNLITGVVEHEVTNTLHDSMPSKHEIKKFHLKRQMLFAKDNPNTILEELPGSENF